MDTIKHKYPTQFNIISAFTFNKQGIGKDGGIPWKIHDDLQHFKEITTSNEKTLDSMNNNLQIISSEYPIYSLNIFNIVIMGRKTWESLPKKPLPNRINIVLSNNEDYCNKMNTEYNTEIFNKNKLLLSNGLLFTNWDKFFTGENSIIISNIGSMVKGNPIIKYHIIGGQQIYQKAMETDSEIILHTTEIYTPTDIECDTFFPKFNIVDFTTIDAKNINKQSFQIINLSQFKKSNDYWYRYITYKRPININSISPNDLISMPEIMKEERLYLDLMKYILEYGQSNNDRTGVGTLSHFGEMLKYNLRDTFPLCTTKRIFIRAVFEELMFYISGKTDNKILQEKGIHVWDGNTTKEFLQKRGLGHYQEGDLGQTYGFNMRHFGGEYKGCQYEYGIDVGFDQLANLIHLLKHEPTSRRLIIDLWDPASVHKAALPSCLCKYQFNVNVDKKELNLAIYLRSSDYFLANNWNTCTGAFFVHMLCNLEDIDLTPGDLTVFIADAHIYKSHIEQVKENLSRNPYPFPKLIIKEKKKNITDFKFEDLQIIGYRAHPNIKADMAV